MQRYAIYLSGFNYDICYKSSKRHANADALSRLPVKPTQGSNDDNDGDDECGIFFTSQIEQLPVTSNQIARETRRDKVLSQIYDCVKSGTWNADMNNSALLKPYYVRRNELSIHHDCLMWGIRVVIPVKLRNSVLTMLHTAHPGIVRMKSIARSYVFWPGIDSELESMVNKCQGCQMQKKSPTPVNVHPWEWPSAPWERVHIDFAGPFLNRMFLVVVDAHSKWPEVEIMKRTTTEKTIHALRNIFSRNGLPRQICTDNGNQFTSQEWTDFMKSNGILHFRTSVAKPSTNGLVERFNSTLKNALRAMSQETNDMNVKLNSFLLSYRNTNHATTGESPAKLFLGRSIRSRLDLLKPNTKSNVENARMKTALSDEHKFREVELGDKVLLRDYRPTSKAKWVSGIVVSKDGPLMYKINIGGNAIWRRHIDQIRKTEIVNTDSNEHVNQAPPCEYVTEPRQTINADVKLSTKPSVPHNENKCKPRESAMEQDKTITCAPTVTCENKQLPANDRRYPTRERKPPERFGFE